MRISRGLLNWGVFLIVLGGVPLAVQQGFADSGIAGDLWRLWPLILVGLGLGMLLRWTPLAWLGGALVAGTLGLIIGALLAGNQTGISVGCGEPGDGSAVTSQAGSASSTGFQLDLALSCGDLAVDREDGARWNVMATHPAGEAPIVSGSAAALSVRQDDEGSGFLVFGEAGRSDWDISLPTDPATSIDVALNAADGTLDLGGGPLGTLEGSFNLSTVAVNSATATTPDTVQVDLSFNASSGSLSLPAGSIVANIDANFSSVTICVPATAELRVELDSIFSADDIADAGLEERGEGWQTAGYDTASERLDLSVDFVFSSLTFQRPEVCT